MLASPFLLTFFMLLAVMMDLLHLLTNPSADFNIFREALLGPAGRCFAMGVQSM